ncbi:hypothetical protein V8E53_012085 [Lactarius tabidus]
MSAHAIADIQSTYGCSFIGLVISILFFGITVCQTRYMKRDPKSLQLFVIVVLLLDTFHTILCTYALYWYLILNFGNLEILQIDIIASVEFLVQLYYARRVYIVSKSIIIPSIICSRPERMSLFFGITQKFKLVLRAVLKMWSRYSALTPIICIGLGTGVLADGLIAFSMCWFLYHKRTGFPRTDSMLMTLMGYSINSGLMTCASCCDQFAISPSSMISNIFCWPMTKIYANSLLAMLNSRDHVRDQSSIDKAENVFSLSSIRPGNASAKDKSSSRPTAVSISVHHSETMDFPEIKHDHDVESNTTTDMRKSV